MNKRGIKIMQYTVLCVGKIKERFYSEAIGEYVKRLSRYANIHIVEVPDEKTPNMIPLLLPVM